jgi:alkylation response protein AidB-like acyl-CoA dehydrogenase
MTTERVDAALASVEKIASVIVDGAPESQRIGRLVPAVFESLCDADLFRMLVPVEMGGLGFTIPETIPVIERVASLDASTGWVLAILADAALLGRFLAADAFEAMCGDPRGLAAGSLNPVTARAEKVEGGYVFSGTATYLSGALHAKWVMASAIVTEGGAPLVVDGMIQIRSGVFPVEQARCLDTWHVAGMEATGSSDYAFDGVAVAEGWTFEPLRPRATGGSDVFSWIPLWSQIGPGIAACAVGAARNMIERFAELAAAKVPAGGNAARLAERAPAQIALGEAQGLCQAARAVLAEATSDIWDRGIAHAPFDNEVLARHRLSIITAVRLAAEAIDGLHDAAGMNAVAAGSVLDRCWRDVHTMTQHLMLSPAKYETAGRILLGLEPGVPVI